MVVSLAAVSPLFAGEVIQTLGRRVRVDGPFLTLTEPDLNRIVVFDVSGPTPRKLFAFGVPGIRPGQLNGPHGAALSAAGELFVADTFNHRVQVFSLGQPPGSRAARLLRAWGDFGSAVGELKAPHSGIALSAHPDSKDLVFVADSRNHRVQAFRRTGEPTGLVIGGPGAEPGKLDTPTAIAFDPTGTVLYVAEEGNRRVSAFEVRRGRCLFTFGGGDEGPLLPSGIAVDASGTVFVTDLGTKQVRRYRPERGRDGALAGLSPAGAWGRVGTGPGQWAYPQSIAVDGQGRVYVADLADDRCQVFSSEGRFLGTFGADVAELPIQAPPPGADLLPRSVCSNGAAYRVEVLGPSLQVPFNELFGLELRVLEGCGEPRTAADVRLDVDAVMPQHRHGMNTQPRVSPMGEGRQSVSGLRLHMSGHWEVHFDVTRGGVTERAQAEVWLE